ncbi:hypothetical protein [Streptomyces californicus]|uniref:hypothetical protein n=1 Tax=Streptomyces californicus TaxID=67351 RepID=UPI0033F719BA
MSVRVYRYVHEQRSHRSVGGTVAPPESDAARWAAMLEAGAISQGLPPDEGQALYEAWVQSKGERSMSSALFSSVGGEVGGGWGGRCRLRR